MAGPQRGSRKHKQNRKGKASTIFKKLGSASDRYQLHHDQVSENTIFKIYLQILTSDRYQRAIDIGCTTTK
jgi:hypothetical protein